MDIEHKLEIDHNDGYYLFHTHFIYFSSPWIGINIRTWVCIKFVYNALKFHRNQPHLQFELQKIEVFSIKLVNDYRTFTLN